MKLVLGVVIFSFVTLTAYLFLHQTVEWPMEVIVISSLFLGGLFEWFYYQFNQEK